MVQNLIATIIINSQTLDLAPAPITWWKWGCLTLKSIPAAYWFYPSHFLRPFFPSISLSLSLLAPDHYFSSTFVTLQCITLHTSLFHFRLFFFSFFFSLSLILKSPSFPFLLLFTPIALYFRVKDFELKSGMGDSEKLGIDGEGVHRRKKTAFRLHAGSALFNI